MTYTKKEREEYNEQRRRSCERLGITKNNYNVIRRIGYALRKCYEDNCNGDYQTEEAYQQAVDPLERKAEEYAGKIGYKVFLQTDPRGATIYLDKVEQAGTDYNRGTCIY